MDDILPGKKTIFLPATDGYLLQATCFGAHAQGPFVVLNSATAVKQAYYAKFALWLAAHDMTVVTYDYRGIGHSRKGPVRNFQASMRDWGEKDFEGVLQYALYEKGNRPLFLVGHSVGGQLLGLAKSNHRLERIVTVASQSGYYGHWQGVQAWALKTFWTLAIPTACAVFGYFPSFLGMGESLPAGVAREWARWGRHPDYLLGHGISKEGFQRMTAEVLALCLTDDFYAPPAAVDWLHALMSQCQVTRENVTPRELGVSKIGHFGFFRSAFQDTLWQRVLEFFQAPQARKTIEPASRPYR